MQSENREEIWFPEPEIDDPTYAKYNEHITGWLARSTVRKAIEYRKALNYHLSRVPQRLCENFLSAAPDHWLSSIFELLVARFLQELGARLVIEEPNRSGKKPDFLAQFPDGTIIVEATAPEFDADIREKLKQRNPLLAIIESQIPSGWNVGVSKIPQIGHSESKKEFKQIISGIMSAIELSESMGPITVKKETSNGEIILRFNKSKSFDGKMVWEPVYALWDETESRIRRAGKRKKQQVKGSKCPVVLAIHASGIVSDWEDFDQATFGHSVELFDENLQRIGYVFREDGFLLRKCNRSLTYAGVLAFLNIDILYGGDPVFYKNPYFEETLPSIFQSLEQRCFNIDPKEIFSIQGKTKKIMDKLRKDALG